MSMEQALQLNNDVVISAKSVREYQSNSLAKNNNIGKVTITNPDFLVSRTEKDAYVFASVDSISGSIDSEWTTLSSAVVTEKFSGTTSTTIERTIGIQIPSGKTQVRVTGSISFLLKGGGSAQKTTTFDVNKTIFYNGDSKTFSNQYPVTTGMAIGYTNVYCVLSFKNGALKATTTVTNAQYFKEWQVTVSISKAEVVSAEGVAGTITGKGGQKYAVGSSFASLTDNGEIFVVPQNTNEVIRPDRTQYATCSYTIRDSTKNETESGYLTSVEEAYVSLRPYFYDNYESFIEDCRQTIPNEPNPNVLYIGLNKQVYKNWNNTLRFDKSFPVYTCVMQAKSDTIYNENVSVKLWKRPNEDSIAYTQQEAVYESSPRDGNAHSIQANSLWQEGTRYGDEDKTLESIIFTDVSEKFKNGRNTTKVSVFYDKYLDLDGSTVYNGVDGYFPKVDDIITPYTIRTKSGADLPTEVPLYTENYITNQDGSQSAVGKQFYVTSCSLEYDGDFRIEIEAIEKTD